MPITTLPTGGIVSYSGTGLYPPFAAGIINAAWSAGATLANSYETKADNIANVVTGILTTEAPAHISSPGVASTPVVVEPTVTIPTSISTAGILADFDNESAALMTTLVTKCADFITTYFPDDSADFSAAEAWISGALANPNGGLPVAVQAQITSDDHARLAAEANRETDTAFQVFAARRFPLPPGALASTHLQILQTKQDKMAESSRKLTMLSVEMMKFAVEKALSLRTMAMTSALDYVKTLAVAPDISSRVVGIGYDAQSKLIGAVSQFIGARTEVKKLVASVEQFNISTSLQVAEKNQSADMTILEDRLKALLTEAQAIAQMSTALFNNLHASASISASVSESQSI